MMDTLMLIIVCTISFAFGMYVERNLQRRGGNFHPVHNPEYDDKWIGEPPPWPLGGSVGEKPPVVVTHLYAPWKNK